MREEKLQEEKMRQEQTEENENIEYVSVVMISYQAERFIAQAIEGVLRQKTDFPIRLMIADDASTDGTAEVIRQYQRQYPHIIFPILRTKNLGASKNVMDAILQTRGKYLAFCEGDDYWIDEHKLQRQITFLEEHEEYVACAHSCHMVNQKNELLSERAERFEIEGTEYTTENLSMLQLPGQMSTMVTRNIAEKIMRRQEMAGKHKRIPLDNAFPLLLLSMGKIRVSHDCMSCYRYYVEEHGTNWSSNQGKNPHNYLLYFYMACALEKYKDEFHVPLDMMNQKVKTFKESFYAAKHLRRPECFLKCLVMLLMEPEKRRYIREIRQAYRREGKRI